MPSEATLFQLSRDDIVREQHSKPVPADPLPQATEPHPSLKPIPVLGPQSEQSAETGTAGGESLLLTEKEAASLLRISPRKLWEIRMQGQIPFIRFGRAIRYSRDELTSWIQDQNRTR